MTEVAPLVVLALLASWSLVLTVLLAAVVRHLGTLEATMLGIARGTPFDFDSDGPSVGSDLPEEVRRLLADQPAGVKSGAVFLFVSTSCGSCVERAQEFRQMGAAAEAQLVVLASGSNQQRAAELRQILAPYTGSFVTDPAAHEIATRLDINSTPFAFRIAGGKVAAKTYVRVGEDIAALLTAESTTRTAGEPEERTHV